jgi:hypothetical protein
MNHSILNTLLEELVGAEPQAGRRPLHLFSLATNHRYMWTTRS